MLNLIGFSALIALSIVVLFNIRLFSVPKPSADAKQYMNFVSLLTDSMQVFLRRATSITAQFLVYVFIVIAALSFLGYLNLDLHYLLAFALGFALMIASHFITLFLMRYVLTHVYMTTQTRIPFAIRQLLTTSYGLTYLMMVPVFLGMIAFLGLTVVKYGLGFAIGVIVASFFLRVGGGIFRASANITKTVVDRVESQLPQDFRNPTNFLDLTGRFIGNIAGFSADMLASYIVVFLALAFSVDLIAGEGVTAGIKSFLQMMPVTFLVASLIGSLVCYFYASLRAKTNATNVLLESIYLGLVLNLAFAYFIVRYVGLDQLVLGGQPVMIFGAYVVGILSSIFVALLSDYLTSSHLSIGKAILHRAEMGPSLVLFQTMSGSLIGNGVFILIIVSTILAAFQLAGVYGIALAALGFLSVKTVLISAKIFHNLALSHHRLVELAEVPQSNQSVSRHLARLGATVNPIGHGFSSASTILASLSLIGAISGFQLEFFFDGFMSMAFVGMMALGIAIVFCFAGVLVTGVVRAVSRARFEVIRQFRELPYLLEGKSYPDMEKASNYHTVFSLGALSLPALVVVLPLVAVVYFLGYSHVIAITFGILLAVPIQSFYWGVLGDANQQSKDYVKSGYQGGVEGRTYTYVSYANEYSLIYNEVLSPNYLVLMKLIAVCFAVVFY